MLEFLLNLDKECERFVMICLIENPLSCWIWTQPAWSGCESRGNKWDFICDFCVFGAPWKKPTQGVAPMGNGASTASRTKLAEPYPRRFCVLRAQALAQDAAGWICYRGFWTSVGVL